MKEILLEILAGLFFVGVGLWNIRAGSASFWPLGRPLLWWNTWDREDEPIRFWVAVSIHFTIGALLLVDACTVHGLINFVDKHFPSK
jgi:hypothetical protein